MATSERQLDPIETITNSNGPAAATDNRIQNKLPVRCGVRSENSPTGSSASKAERFKSKDIGMRSLYHALRSEVPEQIEVICATVKDRSPDCRRRAWNPARQ
eukprot:NODE_6484_length_637_cov_0.721569_g6461_i0.p3 GENE.NODE_6484_length_637_cov_0.721569_g6461_i0~~NODE_6484_length_637_cov_0.721569_g6461_i0.p3  ORF type:complete len:102 (+),score=9.35 NODE_6484_length_637_cov_0.721569_g6461_i0:309-614(+)